MSEEVKDEKAPEILPSEYFEKLKGAKQTITLEKLRNTYDVILHLADKYSRVGQRRSLQKLMFLTQILREEEKLIDLGITTFVYRDTIQDYIDNVAGKCVKIIELSNYMREVPDEIVEVVEKTKDIFTQFFVVFTDYTGSDERRIAQERRDKDPILFGCFMKNGIVADRFYFLGDWEDEYCDLTLDKLVSAYREKNDGKTPVHEIETPQNVDELLTLLKAYNPKDASKVDEENVEFVISNNYTNSSVLQSTDKSVKNKSVFGKVKTFFSRK